ncbi:uncharacterized protein LOC118803149 [Colossoma macropomum]|uniref:uncharacterized protein LOC118803149 n=1 Tax=Colossoma macropomum TaxID=42526 RepID=UPI001863E4F1|nr:uncharacterized protein LOC118803149 [Colossoma macropomum]
MALSRSQKTSWTVSDLIQKSQLISEGKPSRYRLLTTKTYLDESGKIRKWSFGQRYINTQNKVILLVGETGTGKTTLINGIVNYTLGVKINDDVWFEITEEGGVNQTEPETADQTETQTTEVTVYEVFVQENQISVTIIDTPGYGNTRGAEYDKKIAENLLKLFEKDTGVKEIDAVCLVVKAAENRFSDRQHYIFDAILSLFGKDIEENIVIFVSRSTGGPPKNVINAIKETKIPCRKRNGNEPVYFLFDNCQAEQWKTEYEEVYQKAWKLTEDNLRNFFTSLEDQNGKSLETTERVLTEQIQLKACVSNLQECIEFKERKQEELTQIQEALKQNQENIERNEDFSFTVTRSHKEKVSIENTSWWDRKATCCSVCQENCHEKNCWCAIDASWCYVMKDGRCTVCTGKCHYSKHIRENKKYVTESEEKQMTYTDEFENVKRELESNKKEKEEKTSTENRLKEELTKIEKEKTKLVEEACNTIIRLSEIALKPDSAFMVESLDFLIPRAEETGHPDWVQKLKELRKIHPEAETRTVAVLRYLKAGFTNLTGISLDSEEFENVKRELESNKKEKEEKTSTENRLKEELTKIEKEKTKLVEEACNTIIRLSEIALKPDSAFVVKSLDILIPQAEETGHPDWVQKLKELRKIEPEAETP